MPFNLSNSRIRLRHGKVSDAAFIVQLLNQPSFLANIGDKGVRTDEDALNYMRESFHGFSSLGNTGTVIIELLAGTPIGIIGLFQRSALALPDIGFALLEQYQGQGYMSEAINVFLCEQANLGNNVLCAITAPANSASQNTLVKAGFEPCGKIILMADKQPSTLFLLDRFS